MLFSLKADAQLIGDTVINPNTGELDRVGISPLEYRAEYSGDDVIYEGWVIWIAGGNDTASEIWRIAKNYFDTGHKVRTEYAGAGEFLYAWDLRTSYFSAPENLIYAGENVIFNGEQVVYP